MRGKTIIVYHIDQQFALPGSAGYDGEVGRNQRDQRQCYPRWAKGGQCGGFTQLLNRWIENAVEFVPVPATMGTLPPARSTQRRVSRLACIEDGTLFVALSGATYPASFKGQPIPLMPGI